MVKGLRLVREISARLIWTFMGQVLCFGALTNVAGVSPEFRMEKRAGGWFGINSIFFILVPEFEVVMI